MKNLLACILSTLCAAIAFAQTPTIQKMDKNGQSGPSEEARYVLGLVRNGQADLLNKYFDAAPWKIQSEIDAYTNADRTASVALFCVAVDLGNIDVVKAFVEHGYGPADLCRVQTFTTKRIIVSKVDSGMSSYGSASSSAYISSSSDSSSSSSGRGWFGSGAGSSSSSSSRASGASSAGVNMGQGMQYHQVFYGEKQVIKSYFANPLDFASGEMFDYLWSKGFRSNNLFTKQALAEAKRLNRMDIWQYIMDNKPEVLGDKPSYISQADYQALLSAAKSGANTFAYKVLERDLLGQVDTSEQAKQTREKLNVMLKNQLAARPVASPLNPADTMGYARVDQALAAKGAELKRAENAAVAAKQRAQRLAEEKVRAEAAEKAAKAQAEADKIAAKAQAEAERKLAEKRRLEERARKGKAAYDQLLAAGVPQSILKRIRQPELQDITAVYVTENCDTIVQMKTKRWESYRGGPTYWKEIPVEIENNVDRFFMLYKGFFDAYFVAVKKDGEVKFLGKEGRQCMKKSYLGLKREILKDTLIYKRD